MPEEYVIIYKELYQTQTISEVNKGSFLSLSYVQQ